MNTYRTITGEEIDLGSLPLLEYELWKFISDVYEKNTAKLEKGESGAIAQTFSDYVSGKLRKHFFSIQAFRQLMAGTVGRILEDCCKRLLIAETNVRLGVSSPAIPEQLSLRSHGVTVRERQMFHAVAGFCGAVCARGLSKENYEALGHQVALAYGVDDLLSLDRMTRRLAEDALRVLQKRLFAFEVVAAPYVGDGAVATDVCFLWRDSVPFKESFAKLLEGAKRG